MEAIIDNNAACFVQRGGDVHERATVESLNVVSRRVLDCMGGMLDSRRSEGLVRQCHGDLHLGNIFLVDNQLTLFDANELTVLFVDIDFLYDFAFLLMDLEHHGLRRLASIALNRYLDVTGDEYGLAALPLFLSLRAAVRAHVNAATSTGFDDTDRAADLMAEAAGYLEAALRYLLSFAAAVPPGRRRRSFRQRQVPPGEGAGAHFGARPGARVARSDVLRKRLAGIPATTRLEAEDYTETMTENIYETLFDVAGKAWNPVIQPSPTPSSPGPASAAPSPGSRKRRGCPFKACGWKRRGRSSNKGSVSGRSTPRTPRPR